MEGYFIVMGTLLGLILGSFLNALAYRLPRGESLMTRSHCTDCFKQISAWENVPVISWLVLCGKCSGCKAPISIRYPLVEAFTAVVFGLFTAIALSFGEGAIFAALILLSFAFVGILVALIDLDTFRIPAAVVYNGFIVVLIGALGFEFFVGESSRGWTALASAAGYFLLYGLLRFIKPKGIGLGDVRLAPLIGFVLGWMSLGTAIVGFFLPWLIAFICLVPGLVRGKVSAKSKIPFGPWMVLGALLAIAFGDIFFSYYLQLGGL